MPGDLVVSQIVCAIRSRFRHGESDECSRRAKSVPELPRLAQRSLKRASVRIRIIPIHFKPMSSLNRRAFLARIGGTSLCASLLTQTAFTREYAAGSEPHIEFPSAARDRISVASWPFRAYIESPKNEDRDPKRQGMQPVNPITRDRHRTC